MNTNTALTSSSDTGDERDQKLLTITEAADILRTPVATLRYWRHYQTGPHSFRIGRRVFYRYTDLITWLNDQHDHNGPHAA
jgi:hypothetical protein